MKNFWFTIFFLLSCAPPSSPLSCAVAVTLSRRHLLDDDVLPPPPSPTSPPFFPLDSSSPPPPPPPTFAVYPTTFPANISALVLPRSPKPHSTSPTLLVSAISAVLAVATAIGFALFLYGRWQGQDRHFKDSNSSTHIPTTTTTNNSNFSVAAATSPSQVYYLSPVESDRVRTGETCFVKPESPEIQPLPPLPPRSFQPSYEVADEEQVEEEEEEDEFFSPLASLASSANSSPSRSESPSSSGWVSPARSFSITVSPPHRCNPRYPHTYWGQQLESPSPERQRVRKHWGNGSSSLRMFWNQNLELPRISSASTSPERGGVTIRTPLSSLYSSVSNSPDGFLRKFLDTSPPIWNDFSRNVKSVLLSSDSARDFVINIAGNAPLPPPTRPPPLVPPSQPMDTSFKLNKDIVETLFIANSSNPNIKLKTLNYHQDPKEAQDIASMLHLLNLTTKDVYNALLHGDYDSLGVELLECLSRLAPSREEENKLMSYSDDSVFLKDLLHMPFVFKRVDALIYMANFRFESEHLIKTFCILQAACEELKNSQMFSMLVQSILKTGDEINVITHCSSDAHALLRSIAQDMIKSKGSVKAFESSLKGIKKLNMELSNVKKSAEIQYGLLRSDAVKFYQGIMNIEELLLLSEKSRSSGDQWLKFKEKMTRFLGTAAEEILAVKTQESLTVSALEEVTMKFYGDSSKEGQTVRIFMIVREFLSILDQVCKEMGDSVPA